MKKVAGGGGCKESFAQLYDNWVYDLTELSISDYKL
jgi:hypothetical protein